MDSEFIGVLLGFVFCAFLVMAIVTLIAMMNFALSKIGTKIDGLMGDVANEVRAIWSKNRK